MAEHELRTWPEYFQAVRDGLKTFEVRKNDRFFQVGDILLLREYEPEPDKYTGRQLKAIITYILDDFPGLSSGWVVMGMKVVT